MLICFNISIIDAPVTRSRLAVGSSAKTTSGLCIILRAIVPAAVVNYIVRLESGGFPLQFGGIMTMWRHGGRLYGVCGFGCWLFFWLC